MIGFRILERSRRVDAKMAAAYRELPVANISDSMFRMSAGGARLRPMHDGSPMSGPAFTVKSRPGDNLMLHKALDIAEPGDLIVGDEDGVLCVPYDAVQTIYDATSKKHQAELREIEAVARGTFDRAWVDARLRQLGVEID